MRQNRSMPEKQKERWKVKKRMLQKKMQSDALTALGYSSTEALRAVRQTGVTPDMDVETILKLALKNMNL